VPAIVAGEPAELTDPVPDEHVGHRQHGHRRFERLHGLPHDRSPVKPGQAPRRNLTGDPWHSDGQRAVIVVSPTHEA